MDEKTQVQETEAKLEAPNRETTQLDGQPPTIGSALPAEAAGFPWKVVGGLLAASVAVGALVYGTNPSSQQAPQKEPVAEKPVVPPDPTIHPGFNEKLPVGGTFANGGITHKVQPGQYLETIALKYLKFTSDYTYLQLVASIKAANQLNRAYVNPGEVLTIPHVLAKPYEPKVVPKPRNFVAKGVYITNTSAGSQRVFSIINQLKPYGLNTVVFDAKDMSGIVSYPSNVPMVRALNADKEGAIHDMAKFVGQLHEQGIHVVARHTLFFDKIFATKRPDLALQSKYGGPWREVGHLVWMDPNQKEVQDYNINLAKELASMGVDEIQFDYVRFPAMGATQDIKYSFDTATMPKHAVISGFLERAKAELKPYNVLLSVDVFGTVAWDQPIDVKITGQKLEEMAQHVDVISPMLYPSHFYGTFDNKSYPPDHPYYFYEKGVQKVIKKAGDSGAVVRPWVQAFPYRIRNYGPDYIRQQLQGSADSGGVGWLMWNAGNDYDMTQRAIKGWEPKVKAEAPGEEVPKADGTGT